jgi:hypothetical protein
MIMVLSELQKIVTNGSVCDKMEKAENSATIEFLLMWIIK